MGKVLSFVARKEIEEPHISGPARCVQCGHEWVAVCPTGTIELECPSCSTMKGLLKYSCEPSEGALWTCHCGCDVFRITTKNTICFKCGTTQTGF